MVAWQELGAAVYITLEVKNQSEMNLRAQLAFVSPAPWPMVLLPAEIRTQLTSCKESLTGATKALLLGDPLRMA